MTNSKLYDIDTNDEGLVKRRLIGLAMGCPTDAEYNDCPLKDIRQLDFAERLKQIENLTHEERKHIYTHHRKCLSKQE